MPLKARAGTAVGASEVNILQNKYLLQSGKILYTDAAVLSFFFSNFVFNVYLFWRVERETEHEQGRGREGRQNLMQAPGPELSTQSPTWGSNSLTVTS